jgi:hypothetical protein
LRISQTKIREAGEVTFHLVYGMGGGGIGEVRRELAGLLVFND